MNPQSLSRSDLFSVPVHRPEPRDRRSLGSAEGRLPAGQEAAGVQSLPSVSGRAQGRECFLSFPPLPSEFAGPTTAAGEAVSRAPRAEPQCLLG